MFPGFLPRVTTRLSLSPTLLKRNPDFVLRYQSRRSFDTIVIKNIIISLLYKLIGAGSILEKLENIVLSVILIKTVDEPAIL